MDIRTGRTYETKEQALAAGVPESDIAELLLTDGQRGIKKMLDDCPIVRFSNGPFKDRTYRRTDAGHLVRVK